MAVQFGLRPDSVLGARLRSDARLAGGAPPERLRDELFKLLSLSRSAAALRAAVDSGVLFATFPGLIPMRKVRPPAAGVIDVLDHTLEALEHAEKLLERADSLYPGEDIAGHLALEPVKGRPRLVLLKLAVLLHDVSKPETVSRDKRGNVHFYTHEMIGAGRAAELMRRRLRCAGVEADIVARVIRHHLRPGYLAVTGGPTDRAAYRFVRDAGDELYELVVHAMADRQATHRSKYLTAAQQRRGILKLLEFRRAMLARVPRVRLVTGHDLMREFGLEPGPVVGELLRLVEEGVALGRLKSKASAIKAARSALGRLTKPKPG